MIAGCCSHLRAAGCVVLLAIFSASLAGRAQATTLEDALAFAYLNNPQLNAQRARVRAVDENVPQAMAGYRPKVAATLRSGREHDEQTTAGPLGKKFFTEENIHSSTAEISASQMLFDGLATPNRARAAEAQVMAERATLHVMEQQVLGDSVGVYMDVIRDAAIVGLLKNNINALEQQLDFTRRRYQASDVTSTDVAQAESRLGQAQALLATGEANLTTSNGNYFKIIGEKPVNLKPATPVDRFCPPTVDLTVEIARKEHPSVIAAIYDVDVAKLQTMIAQGALYPTVSMIGFASNTKNPSIGTLHTYSTFAGLQATIPIYQGGAEFANIRQAAETATQKHLDLAFLRKIAGANGVQAWALLQSAKTQITATTVQVKGAETAYIGVREEARVGQRTTLDVLNALQELVNARIAFVSVQRDRVVFSYNLLASTGRLSPQVIGLKVPIYDPAIHYEKVRDAWFGLRVPSEIFGDQSKHLDPAEER
jgi:outer membrane protein